MAEAPKSSVDVGEQCKEGPDFFSFYAHEIANLLSEDEDILCNPNASELSQGKFGVANGKGAMDCIRKDAASLFENSIGATLSDFKKGRLRVLLRQSANDLSKEVDEMLGPVLSMCQLKHNLENNILPSSESERKDAKVANNKAKMSSSSSSNSITGNCSPMNASSCEEMDEDVQFLLKNADKKEVKEIIKKYSDDLSAKVIFRIS
ncbi:hypothetical protein COLO4_29198 [Corchorus olitorius]|uniref:NET domain-containing protein n=1 Tax=Corchorus olitorius TaxID=93759 RepID=A0A1R3HG33_9ROSI|nr:hypothetical protein COLO4_29198 [Corchorus olitorius]